MSRDERAEMSCTVEPQCSAAMRSLHLDSQSIDPTAFIRKLLSQRIVLIVFRPSGVASPSELIVEKAVELWREHGWEVCLIFTSWFP